MLLKVRNKVVRWLTKIFNALFKPMGNDLGHAFDTTNDRMARLLTGAKEGR